MPKRDPLREGTEAHYRDAAYYDHAYKRRKVDVAYYARLAVECGGPVLELGVGTGRVAEAIARAGVDVVGVDLMQPMLTRARARLDTAGPSISKRVKLVRGDIRDITRLGLGRFPLVLAPFNVFMHLYSREDVERALAAAHAHLQPRGLLAFDVLMPDLVGLSRDPERVYRCGYVKPPGRARAKYSEVFDYEAVSQVQQVTMIFEPETDQDQAAPTIQRLAHRQFFPRELEALVHYNGFEVLQIEGGFDGEPLDAYAESQVVVARRTASPSTSRPTRARGRRSST